MKYEVKPTSRFKKDVKLAAKQNKNLDELFDVIDRLAKGEKLDKKYIVGTKKESFSVTCLVSEKQFYLENYPKAVVENAHIDDIIVLILGGEK